MKHPKPSVPIQSYWYQALSSPFGIELNCSDSTAIKAKLYAARNEAKDLDLKALSLCISPFDPNKIWIVKREVPLERTEDETA